MVRLGSYGVCELWRRGVEIESVCIEFGWRSEEEKQRRWTMKRFFELEFGYEILSCCWVVKMGLFRGFWVLSNPLWFGGGGGCEVMRRMMVAVVAGSRWWWWCLWEREFFTWVRSRWWNMAFFCNVFVKKINKLTDVWRNSDLFDRKDVFENLFKSWRTKTLILWVIGPKWKQ